MPAPKAVLRDIKDLGLDPNKAYNETTSGGRLSGRVLDANPKHKNIRYSVVQPAATLKSALVELSNVEEPKVEEPKVVEAINEQPKTEVELQSEASVDKKVKSVKKSEKKENKKDELGNKSS